MKYEDAINVLEFDSLKGILRAADDFIKYNIKLKRNNIISNR